jgi:hypothetical protein
LITRLWCQEVQLRIGLPQNLAIMLFGCLVASAIDSYGQSLLEFRDDFTKPACQQRDPFEERIETERHDFTQSAVTVGRGVVQLESGYSYFYKDAEDEIESAHTGPEILVRVGLSEDIEFRLRWNYAWQLIDEGPDRTGSEDLRYSLKLQLTRQISGGVLPTSALEIRGSAPTGGSAFTTKQVEFGLDYIYQWELTEGMTLTGSTGFGTNGFGDFGLIPDEPAEDNFNVMSQSAVLGLELSETNTVYVEWFGIFSDGLEDEFVVSVVNIGVDHYVTDDFVIDVRAGVGLSNDSDDFFVGVGGGYRF